MDTRQWICLSGQYYAYVTYGEVNDWRKFLMDRKLYDEVMLVEARRERLVGPAGVSAYIDEIDDVAQRQCAAIREVMELADEWVEEELPKLRGEREEVDQEAEDRQKNAERAADYWNRHAAPGTPVMYLELGVKDAVLLWTRSKAYAERGRAFVFVRNQMSALPLHEFVGNATTAEICAAGKNPDQIKAETQVEEWNAEYEIGRCVEYIDDPDKEPRKLKTLTKAYVFAEMACVELEGIKGGVWLSKCSDVGAEISDAEEPPKMRAEREEEAEHGVRGTEYGFHATASLVEQWNAEYPVGTLVEFFPGQDKPAIETHTASKAYVFGKLAWVQLDGIKGGVVLGDCAAI